MNVLKKLVTWETAFVALLLLAIAGLGAIGAKMAWWQQLSEATGGWFWWILLLFLVLGIFVVILWLLPRYREKHFLQQMRTEDAQSPATELEERTRKLRAKFLGAIRTLSNSPDLRKQAASPLYALPWYMLLGAPHSGKTTLLQRVAQHFPPFEQPTAVAEGPTQDCDWWLFNTAIILDVTGRYVLPASIERDSAEWYRFLRLLRHYRALQPINGIIIAVAADTLATQSPEILRQEASELRKRLDEAMRELGVTFPVYLLVTRFDLLEGFHEFCNCLPEPILRQVFGHVYEAPAPSSTPPTVAVATRFESVYTTLVERLRQLRLVIYNEENLPAPQLRQRIFCFPEEFAALQAPLGLFVSTLFAENPYQRTPVLRGLFFSSAQLAGPPISFFRRQFHFNGQPLPATESAHKGHFLHDLLALILPRDRYMVQATGTARRGRFLRHLSGFVVSVLLGLLLGAGLLQAFVSDRRIYTAVDATPCASFGEPQRGEPLLEQVETCRQVVQALAERNQQRLAWNKLVSDRSGTFEAQLRQHYVEKFPTAVLTPLDERAEQRLTISTEAIPVAFFLMKRIELLNRCLTSVGCPEPITQDLQPDYKLMLDPARQRSPTPEHVTLLQQTYETYLQWARVLPDVLRQEQAALADRLRRWFASPQFSPPQLLPWANRSYAPVTLQAYWEGLPLVGGRNLVQVEGAYTRRAWEEGFLPFLQRAGEAVPDIQPLLEEFQTTYRTQYFEQWLRFLIEFPRGEQPWLGTPGQRRQIMLKFADERSPYNRLLDVMAENLAPFIPADEAKVPAWARLLRRYVDSPQADNRKTYSRAVYLDALRRIGEPLVNNAPRETSFKLAYAAFQERTPSEKSTHPVLQAMWVVSQWRDKEKTGDASENAFWPVLERPVLLGWKVLLEETGAFLQQSWTEKVVTPAQGLTKMEQVDFFYSPEGKVREFVEQLAKPFLVDNESRFGQVFGETLPLSPNFLKALGDEKQFRTILEIGKKTPQRVKVEATRPSLIDSQTNLTEDKTEFVLECATPFKVNNRSKEATETAITALWSFDTCGDTVLTVSVSCDRACTERAATVGMTVPEATGLRFTKRYAGAEGFWRFLQEFSSGAREFKSNDFPGSEDVWRKYRISMIRVFYRVEAPPTLNKFFSLLPSLAVPTSILK